MAQIVTDKGKIGLFDLYSPYLCDSFNGFRFGNITAQTIDCISRIYNYTAFGQAFDYGFDLPFTGIIGVYF
jgi:hypothetical protein